jgi:NAD(P)-dependent dehydrogenase (short-subunit alcohol dehydrogenase family)
MSGTDAFNLGGKVAIVTGASHGIGEGVAKAYAAAGADIAIAARNLDDLNRVAAEISALGRRVAVIKTDVSDLDQCGLLIERTNTELGGPSILANIAGVNRRKPITDVTLDDWNYIVDINLRAPFFLSAMFAKDHIARGATWGKILHIASMTSFRGYHDLSVYGATKSAIVNVAEMQAVEWAAYGIRSNAIAPGWIETPLTATMNPARRQWVEDHVPQGKYGVTSDIGHLAVYLASHASDYVTGQTFNVDGGFTAGHPWPHLAS